MTNGDHFSTKKDHYDETTQLPVALMAISQVKNVHYTSSAFQMFEKKNLLQKTQHFKPHLFIGPWGECKTSSNFISTEEGPLLKKSYKRRIVKRAQHQKRRPRRQSAKNWPPDFPADLDLAFQQSQPTINALPAPTTGIIILWMVARKKVSHLEKSVAGDSKFAFQFVEELFAIIYILKF